MVRILLLLVVLAVAALAQVPPSADLIRHATQRGIRSPKVGQWPLTEANMEKFGFDSSKASNITFTVADLTYGVNQNLSTSPIIFGIQSFQQLVNITNQGIANLQNQSEQWSSFWFGVTFPPGPVPKVSVDGKFVIIALGVGQPYAAWSVFDSTKTLKDVNPNKASDFTPVQLIEFVVQPNAPFTNGSYSWGGAYCSLSLPSECVIRPGDNVAFGRYYFNQVQKDDDKVGCGDGCRSRNKTVTVTSNFRAFQVTRSQLLLSGFSLSDENFQHCSTTWGAGQGILQVQFPVTNTWYWFFNNAHFPPPTFAALPAWRSCFF